MSYTLFLLLDANQRKEEVLEHLGNCLESNGLDSFCFDRTPDVFFTAEYLKEGNDASICIDIPFGSEETVLRDVLDVMAYLQEKIQIQVLDPQLGKMLQPSDSGQFVDQWKSLNLQALETYSDGRHFLRNVEVRDGKKVMVEALRFQEHTWQNYCSVALAYSRIGQAGLAKTFFEKALELDPQNSGIHHALGVTYFNLRDYEKSKELLTLAVSLDPDNAVALQLIQDCDRKLQV